MIAVLRFDHCRTGQFLGGRPGVVCIGDVSPFGHGRADCPEQGTRQLFILGDRLGEDAGAIDLGRHDAPLTATVAEHDQAAGIQAADGDAPLACGADNGAGARS